MCFALVSRKVVSRCRSACVVSLRTPRMKFLLQSCECTTRNRYFAAIAQLISHVFLKLLPHSGGVEGCRPAYTGAVLE
jgi:hypothetical protein